MAISQKDNGKWQVQIDRKGMPRVRKTFQTEKQAILFEEKYLKDNSPDVSDNRRLMDLIELWHELHGALLKNHDNRKRNLEYLCQLLKNPVAYRLMPEDILRLRTVRLKSIEPKTWNNELGLLKSVYNRLYKLKVIDYHNPIESVDPLRLQEQQLSFLNQAEITTLLHEIQARGKNLDTYWVTQLCLWTGARWGEAERLTRKQLHDGMVTYAKTKNFKTRSIPLKPVFYAELLKHIGYRGNNERCFSNCAKAFEHAVKRAHLVLPDRQLTHICRHTYASHFMMSGGNILVLQKILGHADIKMTMRYAHLAPEHLKDAITHSPMANVLL